MTVVPPWAERAFAFDVPVELHPILRARLAGAPARLDELLRGLRVDQLTARRGGKWSIQENAGHLWDLEALAEVRLAELMAGAETLTAADLANPGLARRGYNDRPLDEVLAGFRRARAGWVGRLDALDPADFGRSALHPRLRQPMRVVDLMQFFAEHDDHHMAVMREVVAVDSAG